MKIISINVNGIRSAANKGLFAWLEQENPDIICFQEIKCDLDKIPQELIKWNNYHTEFYSAQKSGYSGVAIFSKIKPHNIIYGINNDEFDYEGRSIQFDYSDFSVISLYLPSGSSGPDKQIKKFKFMQYYQEYLQNILNSKKNFIICGDWNIAHNEIDLKNWKGNLKNSGFLPEERQWINSLFEAGFIDVWRKLYPSEPGYTWWSNRGQAYAKNVGWRIDYQIVTPQISTTAVNASIYKQTKFSDHAPLIMQYDL